jgi:hypothetical protein
LIGGEIYLCLFPSGEANPRAIFGERFKGGKIGNRRPRSHWLRIHSDEPKAVRKRDYSSLLYLRRVRGHRHLKIRHDSGAENIPGN